MMLETADARRAPPVPAPATAIALRQDTLSRMPDLFADIAGHLGAKQYPHLHGLSMKYAKAGVHKFVKIEIIGHIIGFIGDFKGLYSVQGKYADILP